MIVVSNTSPITNLAQVGYLWVLHQLYGKVIIPDAVQQELEQGIQLRRHPPDFFKTYDWITVKSVTNLEQVRALLTSLGRGEAECVALANELSADLVIIDERRGSQQARQMGLNCIGTLGVLLDAKTQGVIGSVKAVVDALRNKANFWLSDTVYEAFLKEAGEV